MDQYLATSCLETRARMAIDARGGGSIPSWMLQRLRALEDAGSLTMIDGHITSPDFGTADHLWCATGWSLDFSDPLFTQLCGDRAPNVGGLLPLTRSLELPEASGPSRVHVVGRAATAQLGPTAGNLAGARAAGNILVREVCGPDAELRLLEAHGGVVGR